MAEYDIAADQQGAYEIQLEPGEPVTVNIAARYVNLLGPITITVDSGTRPVYARPGTETHVGDPKATRIPQNTWEEMYLTPAETAAITLISAETAVVSVARS